MYRSLSVRVFTFSACFLALALVHALSVALLLPVSSFRLCSPDFKIRNRTQLLIETLAYELLWYLVLPSAHALSRLNNYFWTLTCIDLL